ncbi:MAG: YbjN domain-containing protein [Actinobacteria bacterium]|nr:YbjN domain-containing protein [Actinomycetota bacterium]
MPDPAAARAIVDQWVADQDVPGERENDRWNVMLSGEHKRTVGVTISVGDHTLIAQSFFMRAPDEDRAGVYGLLLRRNLRSYTLRFALHPDGDVLLVGVLPLAAVTLSELDRMLGQLLAVADETFDEALRLGFASYIEREQTWRASTGQPRNPIT